MAFKGPILATFSKPRSPYRHRAKGAAVNTEVVRGKSLHAYSAIRLSSDIARGATHPDAELPIPN